MTLMTAKNAEKTRDAIIWLALFGIFLYLFKYAIQSIPNIREFNNLVCDSTIQYLNAIRRIAAGQRPGIDFNVYHGFLIPYLLYPFWAMGKSIYSAEFATHLLTRVAFVGLNFLFFKSIIRDLRAVLVLTLVSILLCTLLKTSRILLPGYSVLGLRSAMPLIIAAFLNRYPPKKRAVAVVAGVLTAFALYMGSEQGLAVFLGFLLISFSHFKKCISFVAGFILGAALIPAALGRDWHSTLEVLKYNFVDLPADHFWYYGSPPLRYLGSFKDLFFLDIGFPILMLVALGIMIYVLVQTYFSKREFPVGVALLACYAPFTAISYLGMADLSYLHPLMRSVVLVSLYLFWHFAQNRPLFQSQRFLLAMTIFNVALPGAWALSHVKSDIVPSVELLFAPPHLSPPWQEYIDTTMLALKKSNYDQKNDTLWSTCPGYLENALHILPKEKWDILCHTFGKGVRAQYIHDFEKIHPRFVQTLRNFDDIPIQREMVSIWPFYEKVLENYKIIAVTPFTILWERTAKHGIYGQWRQIETQSLHSDTQGLPITIQGQEKFLIAHIWFKVNSSIDKIPLLSKMPKLFIELQDSISPLPIVLAPYETEWSFPINIKAGLPPLLFPTVKSIAPGTSFEITKVEVAAIIDSNEARELLLMKKHDH